MKLSDLTQEQRERVESELVNYIPVADWPGPGEDVNVTTPFGVINFTHEEWNEVISGYSAG